MKIQATKRFVNVLNENIKKFPGVNRFELIDDLDLYNYKIKVDLDPFRNEVDFDARTGYFKAILCIYEHFMHAYPVFITTRELNELYKPGNAWIDYVKALSDYLEV